MEIETLFPTAESDTARKGDIVQTRRSDNLLFTAQMDREHMKLIAQVNEFSAAVDEGASRAELEIRLTLLTECFHNHFNSEECLMRSSSFPGLKLHADEHRKLIGQISGLRNDLGSGTINVCYGLALFVRLWTEQHVTGADTVFVGFLRENYFPPPPQVVSRNTYLNPA